jgi:hypothetical protein
LLRRLGWFDIDVSGQRFGPIFKGQGVQEGRPLTYILGRHIGFIFRVKIPRKRLSPWISHLNMLKKKAFFLCFWPLTKGPIQCPRMLVANPPIPWNNPEYCRFWPTLQQKPGILHYKVTSLEFV